MPRTQVFVVSLVLLTSAVGCRSRKATRADLQAQYDKLLSQYWTDCYGLSLDRGNTARVARCKAEEDKIQPIQQELKRLNDASLTATSGEKR